MRRNPRSVSVSTDAGTLLIVAGVGLALYAWFNRGSIAGAAGNAAAYGAQFAAGGIYGAANSIVNAIAPQQLMRPGAGNPQGFIPDSSSPAYAEWLAQAGGNPGVTQWGTPTAGQEIFRQFTPAPSPAQWPGQP